MWDFQNWEGLIRDALSVRMSREQERGGGKTVQMVLHLLTSPRTSELCCHIHVSVSLSPFSPPVTSSPAHTAFSCSAPRVRVIVTSGKMPPNKQMVSATSSLFNGLLQSSSASLKWSSWWKVWDFMFCSVPCSHLTISFNRVTGARQPLFYLPFTEIPSGTQFHYLLPQTFFLIDIMPYFYPSSFYSLLLLSQKNTAML